MKKIFLILFALATSFSINSCSGSDDNRRVVTGTISFKANGVQKNFSNIHVATTTIYTGNLVEVELDVYGYYIFDSLHLHLDKETLDDTVSFLYESEDIEYSRNTNFAVQLTSNGNDNHLVGMFSGDLINQGNIITITEGTFNIQY